MLGKIAVILLIAAIFYMILAKPCGGTKSSFMPYLPTQRMCDMAPEYWPDECWSEPKKPVKEMCCGASPNAMKMQLKIKEKCCGM